MINRSFIHPVISPRRGEVFSAKLNLLKQPTGHLYTIFSRSQLRDLGR